MKLSSAGESPVSPRASSANADGGPLRASMVLAGLTLAGFGFLYSLAGVGLGQLLFAEQANGSLAVRDGKVVGSWLVAQSFVSDNYFHARPSAAAYDTKALAGSNQARTNAAMRERIAAARDAVAEREGVAADQVPGDLVTQSGSGIDPHVSVQAARIQVERVSRARGMDRHTLDALVDEHIEPAQLGWLGAPRVNVLRLNLALDSAPASSGAARP